MKMLKLGKIPANQNQIRQFAVRFLKLALGDLTSCVLGGHTPFVRIDRDDFMTCSEINIALLTELFGLMETRSSSDWISPLM